MRKPIARTLGLLVAVLLMASAAAQAQTLFVVKAAKLFAKSQASSKVLAKMSVGDEVELLAAKGGWAKVKYQDQVGFVKKTLLDEGQATPVEAPDEGQARTLYAQADTKLYKAPKTSAKALMKVPAGAKVTALSVSGKWCKVQYGGKSGYMLKAKLGETPQSDGAAPDKDKYETLKPGDAGEAVKKLQTRLKALEWFYGDIGGNYQTLTTQAVKDFQQAVGLKETGIADEATQRALYLSDAPKNIIDSNGQPASGKAKEMDWWTSDIQALFPRGKTVTVTDVDTGLSWQVVRMGGTNHADVQPRTAKDTAIMKKAYGGAWSWNRRAIWVSIGGNKYAASMNGMPHGDGSIADNNFDGHHCIHFTNSRTHGSNIICALHQAAIKKAAAAS